MRPHSTRNCSSWACPGNIRGRFVVCATIFCRRLRRCWPRRVWQVKSNFVVVFNAHLIQLVSPQSTNWPHSRTVCPPTSRTPSTVPLCTCASPTKCATVGHWRRRTASTSAGRTLPCCWTNCARSIELWAKRHRMMMTRTRRRQKWRTETADCLRLRRRPRLVSRLPRCFGQISGWDIMDAGSSLYCAHICYTCCVVWFFDARCRWNILESTNKLFYY